MDVPIFGQSKHAKTVTGCRQRNTALLTNHPQLDLDKKKNRRLILEMMSLKNAAFLLKMPF